METLKIITGNTADEIWMKVADDLTGKEVLGYNILLQQAGMPEVLLEVEIDLGGGFEGGYEWTRFSAPVAVQNDFRFALHHEGFLDKAGKLLGLEDKVIGYDDFDKEFIVKTNDEQKVKEAFANTSVRTFFQSLSDFNLHIAHDDTKSKLELEIERAITEVIELRALYDAYMEVLLKLKIS